MSGRRGQRSLGSIAGLCGSLFAATLAAPAPGAELDCVIQPKHTVVVSAPFEGLVATVTVDRGDVVKQGDVVATLESSVERVVVEVSRARAGWVGPTRSAEARLLYAESTLSRQAMLGDMKVTSEAERD